MGDMQFIIQDTGRPNLSRNAGVVNVTLFLVPCYQVFSHNMKYPGIDGYLGIIIYYWIDFII
jgi:hypothetical protein